MIRELRYGFICDAATNLDTSILFATVASRRPVEPAKAMANSPAANINPTTAFALSQRSNVRRSSGDMSLYRSLMTDLRVRWGVEGSGVKVAVSQILKARTRRNPAPSTASYCGQ